MIIVQTHCKPVRQPTPSMRIAIEAIEANVGNGKIRNGESNELACRPTVLRGASPLSNCVERVTRHASTPPVRRLTANHAKIKGLSDRQKHATGPSLAQLPIHNPAHGEQRSRTKAFAAPWQSPFVLVTATC